MDLVLYTDVCLIHHFLVSTRVLHLLEWLLMFFQLYQVKVLSSNFDFFYFVYFCNYCNAFGSGVIDSRNPTLSESVEP